MNIILCGLPMSGKTTLGKQLAKSLGRQFIDTDTLIERAYGETAGKEWTCRQICRELGESFFREIEREQIASLKGMERCIIAIGGGTLSDSGNRQVLQSLGHLVYLKTPENILWKRIVEKGVPSYLDAKNPEDAFYKTAQRRIPLFEEVADEIIETAGRTEQEVLAALHRLILTFCVCNNPL